MVRQKHIADVGEHDAIDAETHEPGSLSADETVESHLRREQVDSPSVGQRDVHFLFHRHAWKIENVCYLQDLYARPETRDTGVGRALIEAVYAAADQAGAPAVYWLTQDFNVTARRLYDRIGKLSPFIRYTRS